jgi:hypothetical protein
MRRRIASEGEMTEWRAEGEPMPNPEPAAAVEDDKVALVAQALGHFKASGTKEAGMRWFFELLVEAAGAEGLRSGFCDIVHRGEWTAMRVW